jgi:4-hydroxyphenylacetate 3-monooxygenase
MTNSGLSQSGSVKNGAEHIESVRDGRAVYLNGKLVHDVSVHPAYRNAVASAGALYDYQSRPENVERMTFDIGSGRRVSRCWQLPHSYAELVERRKALVEWAEVSCGFLGRSPDHVASSMSGMLMGIEVFDNYDEKRGRAFRDWYDHARKNDLFLTYVINNVQGDRSKAFGDQGKNAEDMVARIVDEDASGITIRGAKLFATSAIMANEIFVGSGQPLKPGEENLAFSCALPMGTKGINLLSRKSFEASAVSEYDNPLSSRFDENDALVFFDDVKVPWERVFVLRNTDMCRAQLHDTPAHVYQNYQAQIRLSVKLRFLVGLARGIARTIGTINFPPVVDVLGKLASQASLIDARQIFSAQQAVALCRAGSVAGDVSGHHRHDPGTGGRGTDDAAVLRSRFRQSGDRPDDFADAGVSGHEWPGPRQAAEADLGRRRLGVRFPPPAIRDVLCRRPVRDARSQLSHL